MKLAAVIHKGYLHDPEVLPAETALEMATSNGAHAMLWGENLGSLESGKLADVIVINQRKPHLVPVRNPISNLVYAASGSDVDTVIIDGEIIMQEREVKTIDERDVIERAQKIGLEVDKRLGLNIGPKWPVV
jgi:cytosine/adenosine deaminase-related metal-dependent hydrolase